jgi:phage terminase small subunit
MRRPGPGRPPKPIEAKVLDGTYRPGRDGPLAAADLPGPPPEKPANLSVAAGEWWDRIVVLMAGIVKPTDIPLLTDVCRWLARMDALADLIDSTDPTDPGYHKALIGAAICTDKLSTLSTRFGMTPADRARLRVNAGPQRAKVATRPRTKLDAAGPPKN